MRPHVKPIEEEGPRYSLSRRLSSFSDPRGEGWPWSSSVRWRRVRVELGRGFPPYTIDASTGRRRGAEVSGDRNGEP